MRMDTLCMSSPTHRSLEMITLITARPWVTCHGLFMDSLAELQPGLKVHGGDTTSMPHMPVLMEHGLLPLQAESSKFQRHAQRQIVPSGAQSKAGTVIWRADWIRRRLVQRSSSVVITKTTLTAIQSATAVQAATNACASRIGTISKSCVKQFSENDARVWTGYTYASWMGNG